MNWYIMNIRILETMVSGWHFFLGLGTKMYDPHVYVVFGVPARRSPANLLWFWVGSKSGDCASRSSA